MLHIQKYLIGWECLIVQHAISYFMNTITTLEQKVLALKCPPVTDVHIFQLPIHVIV